ncbi:phage holin [Vagococcus fluvialis]|uniref:phage holin n=1 Tax=Vagococcus fluvialis TaxID=2738 RepID=UPI003B590D65
MKKINWEVRIKNKTFWLTIVPAILLVIQVTLIPFGYEWDFTTLSGQLIAIINAVFAVLSILGIVIDPVTKGLSDSDRAMTYKDINSPH